MGQCSSSTNNNGGCCMNHVVDGIISGGGGGENLEMRRNDSPDPVMYDLMRKSIAATCPTYPHGSSVVVGFDGGSSSGGERNSSSNKSSSNNNKRRNGPPGQHHLLYKQNSTTTTTTNNNNNNKTNNNSCTSDQQISSNNSTSQQNNNNNQQTQLQQNGVTTPTNIMNNWLPNDIPPQCPTRLLIRRRSLKVVEEGGGTHIYAIRYPEDTKDTAGDSSEQTTFSTSSPRGQEQCPTPSRRQPTPSASASSANGAMASSTTFSNTATSLATTTTTTTTGSSNPKTKTKSSQQNNNNKMPMVDGDVFTPAAMNSIPRQSVIDWVTVSEEHNIYIADAGLTALQCDYLVNKTEHACRGQYAAYTYAKQTLGCREFPILAQTSFMPVHTVVHAITQRFHPHNQNLNSSSSSNNDNINNNKDSSNNNKESSNSNKTKKQSNQPILLQLDDREPHIVKYDVTKKERQKLDMHTDKSEWTFLIALSNGCGVDYEGGGTYFECLDATVHIQRGHALIFPGKLRHCGQKITSGLRFLLVGFLVDKTNGNNNNNNANSNTNNNNNSGGGNNGGSGSTNKNSNKSNNNNNSGSTTPPSPPGVPPMRQIYENK